MSKDTCIKCILVGDYHVSKTRIITRYEINEFPDYIPTVFDNYSRNLVIDGVPVCLALWDTGGAEDYERLRPLSYPQTDVFMICFSVINRNSFDSIPTKWVPEVRHYCPETPFVFVGTMVDIREKGNKAHVSQEEGFKAAQRLGASAYLECSAKTGEGVAEAFEEAGRVGLYGGNDNGMTPGRRRKTQRKCTLL